MIRTALLVAALSLLPCAGCATSEEELQLRIAEAKAAVDVLRDAGFHGTATIVLEEQPMRAGLFEGVVFEPPVRLKVITSIAVNPAEEEPR